MALGHAEGFFGIVLKIRLREQRRMIIDDLDSILIGSDGAVRAESPEFAADYSFLLRIKDFRLTLMNYMIPTLKC